MVPQKLTEMLVDIDDKIASQTEVILAKAAVKRAQVEEERRSLDQPQPGHDNSQWTSDAYNLPNTPRHNTN
ncbi:hypothetical protein K7432_009401 [Basidiobolus ranarum]|uniref:Uncharacterized protein n=1 Tax=Basidiobolus ranarum TaxID=34480 RepID=A0ABR2WQI1_9FUNG